MTPGAHVYSARCAWRGTTAAGYESYGRTHSGALPRVADELGLSADPAFGGDPRLVNPEQMLVLAASSCQLLSFLAVAARAHLDVRSYEDDARGIMSETDRPMWIGRIELRPHIVLSPGPTEERVRHLVEIAHRECFIANSLRTDIAVVPGIEFAAP